MNVVMKIVYKILFQFIWILPLHLCAQLHEGFKIDGHMPGLKEGEKITLRCMTNTILDYTVHDSAYAKNGEFHIQGLALDGARYYWMAFDKHPFKVLRLFVNNKDNVTIHSRNIDSIPHDFLDYFVKVEGSRSDEVFKRFLFIQELYIQSMVKLDQDHLLKEITDSIGFDPSTVGAVLETRDAINQALYYTSFYKLDTGFQSVPVLPFLVRSSNFAGFSYHSSFLIDIYNSLDESTKNSFEGKLLKEKATLSIGQPFPAFTLSAPDGGKINLTDIVKKGKVTIVHFWAVNSVERTRIQSELRMLYGKYHDKGLNIIGVSSDDSSTEYNYKKLVREQAFPWPNVCDLKGKDGIVETVYHEFALRPQETVHNTTNVLIGADGKIIAWDISGVELQWYLWKIFQENTPPKK